MELLAAHPKSHPTLHLCSRWGPDACKQDILNIKLYNYENCKEFVYWCVRSFVWQVELFEFHGEDITDEEDGGIIRRIITKGEGYTKPNEGASVEGKHSYSYNNQ